LKCVLQPIVRDRHSFHYLHLWFYTSWMSAARKSKKNRKQGKQVVVDVVVPRTLPSSGPPPRRIQRLARGDISRVPKNRLNVNVNQNIVRQQADQLALSLSVPAGRAAIRRPSPYNNEETTACTTTRILQVDWSGASTLTNGPGVPVGNQMVVVFREVLRAYIVYDKNYVGAAWGGVCYFATYGNMGASLPISTMTYTGEGGAIPLPIAYVQNSGGYQPHTQFLYAGAHLGRKGIWIDADTLRTTNITFQVTGGGLFETNRVNAFLLAGNDWSLVTSTSPDVAGNGLLVLSRRGYYAFDITDSTDTARTLNNFAIAGTCDVFAHLPVNGIATIVDTLGECRVNAASALWTNTAPIINRGGQVTACQIAGGEGWFNNDRYTKLASRKGAESMGYDNGIYGYHKMSDERDVQMNTWVTMGSTSSNDFVADYQFDLVSPVPFVVFMATVPLSGTTWPGGFGQLCLTSMLEWKTDSPIFDARPADVEPEVYNMALRVVRDVPQFHSNPVHLAMIGAAIVRGLSALFGAAVRYAPVISTIGSTGMQFMDAVKSANDRSRRNDTAGTIGRV